MLSKYTNVTAIVLQPKAAGHKQCTAAQVQ